MFARSRTYLINIIPNQKLEAEESGHEAFQLGTLASAGVPVPEAFVVTGTAFDDFITSADLVDKISSLISQVDASEPESAKAVSEEISKLILGANLPSVVINPIVHAYRQLSGFTDKYVMIKPSWILPAELVPTGHDYWFDNVKGEGAVVYHLKRAWTALFSPQALLKRSEYQYHGGLSIAVVIQKLVQSEVSGVAFSADPITMDQDYIQIEAVLGLLPDPLPLNLSPDVYKVEKSTLHIVEKNILEQDTMTLRKGRASESEEPVIRVSISSDWRRKQKLDDVAISTIAEMVKSLEQKYQHPVEIEWVYETGKISITSLRELAKIELPQSDLSARLSQQLPELPEIEILSDAPQPEPEVEQPQLDMEALTEEVNELLSEQLEDEPIITPELSVIPEALEEDPQMEVVSDEAEGDMYDKIVAEIEAEAQASRQQREQEQVETPEVVAATPETTLTTESDQTQEPVPVPESVELQPELVRLEAVAESNPLEQIETKSSSNSILDMLPSELKAKIEKAAADAPEDVREQELEPEVVAIEELSQEASTPAAEPIVEQVKLDRSTIKEIVVTKPISETYQLNTPVYLDISAVDSGTLANGANFNGAYLDGTAMVMRHKILPESLAKNNEDLRKLIEAYALEISTAAKAIGNKPMYYAFSDIGDAERAQLLGEVKNEGGLDGSERFVLKPEALISELMAVKRAKTVYGATNIHIIMPKLRTELEIVEMKKIMNTLNFHRTSVTQLFAEVATPAFLYELEHTEASDIDGVVINFNKLAQGMTGRSEFVARDHKPILSAIKLMLDFNRAKKLEFILKLSDNPELIDAAFQAKIYPNGFIFNGIPSEQTFQIIQRFELAPLKQTAKRGRRPKDLT